MKKTIWIINEYAGSPYHGMVYRHYYIGRELVKKGYKVYIIAASFSHLFFNQPKIRKKFDFEVIDGINYIWTKVPKYKHSRDKVRAFKWLTFTFRTYFQLPTDSIEKPDVILVSSPAPFPIISGYKWAKRYNAKFLCEIRDIWPLTLIELGNYSPNHPFIKLMEIFERFAYEKADKIISVLPLFDKYLKEKGFNPDKFVYIPNGICIDEVNKSEPLSKEIKRRIPADKFIVIYTGAFGKPNALEYLIKAARLLKSNPDIRFILLGKGGEEQKLKELARNLKLNNVIFIPPIPKKQIQGILKLADSCYIGLKNKRIFRYGVSPNKLFDYMLSEKPIIYAVNSGNNPVKEFQCGVTVEAENPKAIAEGILKLYKMTEKERREMGKRGRNYVLKYHIYKKLADRFEEILLER